VGTLDWFLLIRLEPQVTTAVLIYEDGNGYEHARQAIPHADFPFEQIWPYACWDA